MRRASGTWCQGDNSRLRRLRALELGCSKVKMKRLMVLEYMDLFSAGIRVRVLSPMRMGTVFSSVWTLKFGTALQDFSLRALV